MASRFAAALLLLLSALAAGCGDAAKDAELDRRSELRGLRARQHELKKEHAHHMRLAEQSMAKATAEQRAGREDEALLALRESKHELRRARLRESELQLVEDRIAALGEKP